MNENVLLAFGPILNEPWAIDARREYLAGSYFVVSGKEMEDILWERDKKEYYGG